MPIQLKNLRSGEKVDSVIRRHWIVFAMLGVYAISGVIGSLVMLLIFGFAAANVMMMVCFWLLYSMFLYINWLNYELDLFIVTNNRVICIEQKSFLNRAIGECTLDKVQEVGIETKGIFANLLNYGTVTLRTAGATSNFDMSFSPKPMDSARHINNVVDRYRDSHSYNSAKGGDGNGE